MGRLVARGAVQIMYTEAAPHPAHIARTPLFRER